MKFSTVLTLCLMLSGLAIHANATRVMRHVTSNSQLPGQDAPAPLNNKDVVALVKAGLTADIIVAKIKASRTNFDTSATALQELKAAEVPDAVILAMVQAPTGTAANTSPESTAVTNSGDPKATVYVYRKKNFNTRNMQPSVYLDGEEVARMDDGKYFAIKLEPGKHRLEVNKGHSGAEIDMKAGEQYYFRIDIKPGFWKGRGEILYMQKEQGSLEIQKMNPLEDKWIKDKSKVTADSQTIKRG